MQLLISDATSENFIIYLFNFSPNLSLCLFLHPHKLNSYNIGFTYYSFLDIHFLLQFLWNDWIIWTTCYFSNKKHLYLFIFNIVANFLNPVSPSSCLSRDFLCNPLEVRAQLIWLVYFKCVKGHQEGPGTVGYCAE